MLHCKGVEVRNQNPSTQRRGGAEGTEDYAGVSLRLCVSALGVCLYGVTVSPPLR